MNYIKGAPAKPLFIFDDCPPEVRDKQVEIYGENAQPTTDQELSVTDMTPTSVNVAMNVQDPMAWYDTIIRPQVYATKSLAIDKSYIDEVPPGQVAFTVTVMKGDFVYDTLPITPEMLPMLVEANGVTLVDDYYWFPSMYSTSNPEIVADHKLILTIPESDIVSATSFTVNLSTNITFTDRVMDFVRPSEFQSIHSPLAPESAVTEMLTANSYSYEFVQANPEFTDREMRIDIYLPQAWFYDHHTLTTPPGMKFSYEEKSVVNDAVMYSRSGQWGGGAPHEAMPVMDVIGFYFVFTVQVKETERPDGLANSTYTLKFKRLHDNAELNVTLKFQEPLT